MPLTYPAAHQDPIQDDYHGTLIADPYRWLENPATPESREWTDQQNHLTQAYLKHPMRQQILERLTQLCDYDRQSAPEKRGDRYFFWKHSGLQNQPVLYWQHRFTESPQMLVNPNTLSKKGTVSVMSADPSRDGKYLAYSLSQSGSDWQEVHIRKVKGREDLPEVLHHCKFSGIAWHPNHKGFYYNRYPDPATVQEADQSYYNKVYWHQLDTDQSDDLLVYERPDQKDFDFFPQVSEDGKYLVITAYLGTDRRNRIYYRELDSDAEFTLLLDQADAHYRFIGNQEQVLYFFTDKDAPRGKVIAIDLDNPSQWQTVIAEGEDSLTNVLMAARHLVCVYLHHAHHRLFTLALEGGTLNEIPLPAIGSITELSGKLKDNELFISFSSFLFPARSYMYHFESQDLDEIFVPRLDFDPEAYETKQAFCESLDGTRVPMFIVQRKDLDTGADTPTQMYGYGGFRQALTPAFSATLLPWLEQGGRYVIVNLRGGSEYGTEWYQAGTLERKQNVFDDFISAGKYLVQQNLTRPEKLSIRGGSNGGLLVGACMLQAPELFASVICQVPVIDMLRYHRFTIGRYWVSDYGNAEENPEHFAFLRKYSPLHNVKAGQAYPAVLITTADHDDRVVPAHAKKFAATLQANAVETALLRVDTDAGHGRGKPISKMLEEMADIYTFLALTLHMNWK